MKLISLVLLLSFSLFSQVTTLPNQAGGFVYTGALSGIPATCTTGQISFITDATAGQNQYNCTATNTWTQNLNSGSGGASVHLDNLSAVNLNSALLAQTGIDLGSAAKAMRNLYFFGAGTYGTTSMEVTGTPTAARVWTFQDASDTVVGRATTDTLTNKSIDAGQLTGTVVAARLPNAGVMTGDVTTTFPAVTIGAGAVTNSKIANTTIDLTTKVTGVLPEANGGTGANNTVGAAGHVLRSNATHYVDAALGASDLSNGVSGSGAVCLATGSACSGGAANSVFTGSTATNPAFSATPTFSLADVSVKSPVRVEPGALTANVTAVTFTNKTAGAKFSIAWLQDGTGGRTVAYGASASGTCPIDPTANATTTQKFEVGADGSTVNGTGCSASTNIIAFGPEIAAPGTPPASDGFAWFDSTNHIFSVKQNNSATVSSTVVPDTGASNNFLTAISAAGVISKAQPAFSNLSGSIALAQTPLTTRGDILVVNSTPALARLAKGTQYQTLQGGASDTLFDAVHLDQATAITGNLPAANVASGALANGMTATTQTAGSNDTKVATDAYVDATKCTTTITTGTTGTLSTCFTVNQEATAGTGVTYTLPTAASGLQYCIDNGYNGSAADTGILTFATSASGQFMVFTDGTLTATGGNVTSGGAARDGACVYGIDSTHWMFLPHAGVWTKH